METASYCTFGEIPRLTTLKLDNNNIVCNCTVWWLASSSFGWPEHLSSCITRLLGKCDSYEFPDCRVLPAARASNIENDGGVGDGFSGGYDETDYNRNEDESINDDNKSNISVEIIVIIAIFGLIAFILIVMASAFIWRVKSRKDAGTEVTSGERIRSSREFFTLNTMMKLIFQEVTESGA